MRVRSALSALAAGVGGLSGINAVLNRRVDQIDPALSGDHDSMTWNEIEVSYTEAGDPTDHTLVLLHGINAAGSSGEFRKIFTELSDSYHVVAPDLPGFGTSDRPSLRYSAAFYEEFIQAFLTEDCFESVSVIASSLTGAYLASVADDMTTDIESMVFICPTERGGPNRIVALRELLRAPVIGTALFNLLTSKPSIRYFNTDHGYYNIENISETWMEYEWQTAHQPNARYAPASFISGFLNKSEELETTLSDIDVPVTLLWGREADITPLQRGRKLAKNAGCRLVVVDDAKLLPHVEFPDQCIKTIQSAVNRR
jgi:Predicted hydrolases or acyltransferases (alpha/beta hydrolase superfamily)